jgi:hypothetical protein
LTLTDCIGVGNIKIAATHYQERAFVNYCKHHILPRFSAFSAWRDGVSVAVLQGRFERAGRHIAVIHTVAHRVLYLLVFLVFGSPAFTAAQEASRPASSAPDDERGWMAAARRWFDSDDDTVPRFTIVFGGIKQGSGPAAGPAVGYTFSDGSFVQARAEYSVHSYKLLQTRYQSRPLGSVHAIVSSRIRWQDAPSIPLFELGPAAPELRALYAERRTEYSGEVMLRPTAIIRLAGGLGYERYRVGNGRTDPEEDESLSEVPRVPGLGVRPLFLRTFAAAGVDTRQFGDMSRRGSRASAAVHHFSDRDEATYSFSQFVLDGEQLFPVAHERGALSIGGSLWASNGAVVPFFLMPTLGGGEYLRGYRTYRFRDRDALVLTAELEWRVHEYVDADAFVDVGQVAPQVSSLRLGASQSTQGIGIRVRTPKKTIFRLDVARSVEGFQLVIGFSSRTSAIF